MWGLVSFWGSCGADGEDIASAEKRLLPFVGIEIWCLKKWDLGRLILDVNEIRYSGDALTEAICLDIE